MIESKAAFARRLGVNKSTVTRAAEAGRIVLTPRGQVEVEKSLERWHATKGARSDVAARHAEKRGADIPEAAPVEKNATKARKTSGAHSLHNSSVICGAGTPPKLTGDAVTKGLVGLRVVGVGDDE